MKRNRLTALILTLCLSASLLLGGCRVNLNLTDDASGAAESSVKHLSELASDIADKLDSLTIEEKTAQTEAPEQASQTPQSSQTSQAAAKAYTMADVKQLKNTEHFAKHTLEHIFDGTINSKGNATGYHYSKISDSKGEIIQGTESKKDSRGVFTAKVKVSGVKKNGFSSFYPESWTPQQVVDAINEAYADALSDKSNPHGSLWIGYSGDLEIDMYLDNSKRITTAYPIYEGDK